MSSSDELPSSSSVEMGSRAKSSRDVGSDGAGEVIIEGESFGFDVGGEVME